MVLLAADGRVGPSRSGSGYWMTCESSSVVVVSASSLGYGAGGGV